MENIQISKDLEESDTEKVEKKPLQKKKVKKSDVPPDNAGKSACETVEDEPVVPKPKREKTEAQKAVFEIARAKMLANAIERKAKKALEDEAKKKDLEQKIVQKAIAIKKKEIKRKAVLDEISDDDTDIAEIKEIVKTVKPAVKREPAVKKEPIPEKPKSILEKYKFI